MGKNNTIPTRPLLKYMGGKWRIAQWCISHLPPHETYVEPFGGSAGVLLQKPRSRFEVYNDRDEDVVNLFQVLRDQPAALVRAISLTPWSRRELALAWEPATDPLEAARRTYTRFWQSWHGHGHDRGAGWRYMHGEGVVRHQTSQWRATDHLDAIAARLIDVQIECDDALSVIRRFDAPSACFYIDPPYVHSVRARSDRAAGRYTHEMDDDDHAVLARLLRDVQGYVVVSGYESDLYQSLYPGWSTVRKGTRDGANNRTQETLWLSPRTAQALAERRLL